MRRYFAAMLLSISLLGAFAISVMAQGILVPGPVIILPVRPIHPPIMPPIWPPRPIPLPPPTSPFCVKSVHVSSVITDSVVETSVEQTFINTASVQSEGTYLFPLPDGATISSFSLKADGKVLEARILSKEEAKNIYESIVRRQRDPALLEYVDRGVFKSSVFPIPAGGERTLILKYVEVLKTVGGLSKFSYPLSTGQFSTRPIVDTSVQVKIKTTAPLKSIYSPSHDVSTHRTDDHNGSASWERHGDLPDQDFVLYIGTGEDTVGLSLLTYQGADKDGYFMLLAAPRVIIPRAKIMPRRIVFVLDRTGSMMSNHKIDQAKEALKFCLDNLSPEDSFDVISFNESPDLLSRSLLPATKANADKARTFVSNVDASGGTNIDEALRTALKVLDGKTSDPRMVIFLTDGLPTVGETNVTTILDNIRKAASAMEGSQVRIFSFGVGYDVNVPFLDQLAQDSRGANDYVRPEESIEKIVSAFYSKVTSPIMSDVKLAVDGVDILDVYPKNMPDIFKGSQLVIAGRYRGDREGTIKLTGSALGQPLSFQLPHAFGRNSATSSLIPRIWAVRKIGYLLDQVRLHNNQEVINEIVRLSKDYGIITPYTSYLADDSIQPPPMVTLRGGVSSYKLEDRFMEKAASSAGESLLRARGFGTSGGSAVAQGLNSGGYQGANSAPAQRQGRALNDMAAFYGGGAGSGGFGANSNGGRGSVDRSDLSLNYGDAKGEVTNSHSNIPLYKQVAQNSAVQSLAGRVFYLKQNIWFDNNYQSGQKVIKIKAFSEAYFQALRAVPMLNKYAAIGDETVVSVGKNAVQFGADGKDTLTDADLKDLKTGV